MMTQPLLQEKTTLTRAAGACVIAVSSGKGGVGKTNIVANLGLMLASRGKRVCLFDADTNLANINILLNITTSFTLEHLLSGEKSIDEILVRGPAGIQIVPAASGIAEFINLNRVQQDRLITALRHLESSFDYLLIDTAAGINESVLTFLQASPLTLMAITTEPTSLTDTFSLLKVLTRQGFDHPVFVVVNMAPNPGVANSTYKRFNSVVAKYLHLELHYLGYVLNDIELVHSVLQQKAVVLRHPESTASRCFNTLSDRLDRFQKQEEKSASFCNYWCEKLLSAVNSKTESDNKRDNIPSTHEADQNGFERARQHILSEAVDAKASEALLIALTKIWIRRFGQAPAALMNTLAHPLQREDGEDDKHTIKPQPKPTVESGGLQAQELAGLRHAMQAARNLTYCDDIVGQPHHKSPEHAKLSP